jgi:glycosyltransferase involved in cell wall biosynthesis
MSINHSKNRLRLLPGCVKPQAQYAPSVFATGSQDYRIKIPQPINLYLISVVIPSFNQGQYLQHCLSSIVSQGYDNVEIIVVDGGSSDMSLDVIRHFEGHLSWWVSEPDGGQASAINKGMAQAKGDILCWLNSDDCFAPHALHVINQAFHASPAVDVIYGHRVLIDESGHDVGKWILPYHSNYVLTYVDFVPQETMFWRASAWKRTGEKLDESLDFAIDWDLISRFIAVDSNFLLLPHFLGQFRIHADQKTQKSIDQGFREMGLIRHRHTNKAANGMLKFYLSRACQLSALGLFLISARIKELLYNVGWIKIK